MLVNETRKWWEGWVIFTDEGYSGIGLTSFVRQSFNPGGLSSLFNGLLNGTAEILSLLEMFRQISCTQLEIRVLRSKCASSEELDCMECS